MSESESGGGEWTNSICSVYAHLIENEVRGGDPDVDTVLELTGYIKKHCSSLGFPSGETPEHLEEYLFESE